MMGGRNLTSYLFLISIFFGCHEYSPTKAERALKDKKDSITVAKLAGKMDILMEMGIDTSSLKLPLTMESSLNAFPDSVQIWVKKKFDETQAIDLPRKYLDPVAVEHFDMFSPYYEVIIKANGKVVAADTIRCADFWAEADTSLRTWGVLGMPDIRTSGDSVELAFNYVIPLTDVGIRVRSSYRFR